VRLRKTNIVCLYSYGTCRPTKEKYHEWKRMTVAEEPGKERRTKEEYDVEVNMTKIIHMNV
jgi:hypothetical protein